MKTNSPSSPGVILGFRWSKCNQKFEECHDLQRKNEMHKIDIIMLQLSRAKPGNPASMYIYVCETRYIVVVCKSRQLCVMQESFVFHF